MHPQYKFTGSYLFHSYSLFQIQTLNLRKGFESGRFLRLRPNQLTWKPDAVNIEQQSMQAGRLFPQVSLRCVGNEDAVVGNCVNYSFPPVFPLSNMLPDR